MKITAKSTIKHNGAVYNSGDVMPSMNEAELAKLVAANVVNVEGADIKPERLEDVSEVASDAVAQKENTDAVANLPIAMNMTKEKLIGIARANGLEVDKTTNRNEAYKMIKEYREKNNIVIEDNSKADEKAEGKEDNGADEKADTKSE